MNLLINIRYGKGVNRMHKLALPLVLASSTTTTSVNGLDGALDLVKSVMELFTEYPLNVYLVCGLACVGFGVFRAAKGAAKR